MGKLRQVVDGYKYLLFENKEIEKMANERLEFCDKCEEVDFLIGRFYLHCKKCGCWIPTLLRSPSKRCNLGKF